MPRDIAVYLGLDDPNTFTGHAFRRTSATLLAHAGGNMIRMKELGGWKSDATAQGYVAESLPNKIKTSELICSNFTSTSTVKNNEQVEPPSPEHQLQNDEMKKLGMDKSHQDMSIKSSLSGIFSIQHCNVTINYNPQNNSNVQYDSKDCEILQNTVD